jgi:hypothetical protein
MLDGAHGVPRAQTQEDTMLKGKLRTPVDTKKWIANIRKGFENIIKTGRIRSQESIDDLDACLRLLEARPGASFSWDMTLYMEPRNASDEYKLPSVIQLDDPNASLVEEVEHNVMHEDESSEMPNIMYMAYYLIKLERPPYWGIGQ